MRETGCRYCVFALLTAAALLGSAVTAQASSTVGLVDNGDGTKTMYYMAGPTDASGVQMALETMELGVPQVCTGVTSPSLCVADTGTTSIVNASPGGCTASGTEASCLSDGVTQVVVGLGNGGSSFAGIDVVGTFAAGPSSTIQAPPVMVTGGTGIDTITTGSDKSRGDHIFYGGSGNDTIRALVGRNLLFGQGDSDRLVAQRGTAELYGGPDNDQLQAGCPSGVGSFAENKCTYLLQGGGGADTISAPVLAFASPMTTLDYSDHAHAVSVTPDGSPNSGGIDDGPSGARDTVTGSFDGAIGTPGNDLFDFAAGTGSDGTFEGREGNDSIVTGPGDDTLEGGAGNDILSGGLGSDELDGGDGSDAVNYAFRTEGVSVSLDDLANDGAPGEEDDAASDNELILGGQNDDVLIGSDSGDSIFGGAGDDTYRGRGGQDLLSELFFGADGGGDDSFTGGEGADVMVGGSGRDTADYSDRGAAVTVTPGTGADDGGAGEGDDVGADVESATGGAGDDRLTTAAFGGGTLVGGSGDDLLTGFIGPDTLVGGPGQDAADYSLRNNPTNLSLDGLPNDGEPTEGDDLSSDIEELLGGAGSDTLVGNDNPNALMGGGGDDNLHGGGNADALFGQDGNDDLRGDQGADQLSGGEGADTLVGGDHDDVLSGDAGDDLLPADPGADTLNGGAGRDTADYSVRGEALGISLNGAPDDGAAGEHDNVRDDVEALHSGSGNDQIDSRNGLSNSIFCDGGNDTVRGDDIDATAPDCENVSASRTAVAEILTGSVRATRSGRVVLRIACRKRTGPCAGTLSLVSANAVRLSKAKRRKLKLGSKPVSIPAGKTQLVPVKLSRKGRKALARVRKLSVKATLTLGGSGTVSRTVAVRAGAKRKGSR